jgi:hypothetical protein
MIEYINTADSTIYITTTFRSIMNVPYLMK